jgi:hypothetical protein
MQAGTTVNEGLQTILETLHAGNVDAAKKMVAEISRQVKTERERGSVMAISGLVTSVAKAKDGTMQTWDLEKVARAAKSIKLSQMSDEFDRGYAQTLEDYARLMSSKS